MPAINHHSAAECCRYEQVPVPCHAPELPALFTWRECCCALEWSVVVLRTEDLSVFWTSLAGCWVRACTGKARLFAANPAGPLSVPNRVIGVFRPPEGPGVVVSGITAAGCGCTVNDRVCSLLALPAASVLVALATWLPFGTEPSSSEYPISATVNRCLSK